MHAMYRNLDKLKNLCTCEQIEQAMDVMYQRRIGISRNDAYYLLTACCTEKEMACGTRMQHLIEENGLNAISVLGDHLIRLFASFGCLHEADRAFNKIIHPTVYTWSSIILAHADQRKPEFALQLYHSMQLTSVKSNQCIYVAALKACTLAAAVDEGRLIHLELIDEGLGSDIVAGNTLLDMYAKCGCLEEACNVFHNLPNKSVVSWGAMIGGYAQNKEGLLALDCFDDMHAKGLKPDLVTFLNIIKACGIVGAIERGRHIHEQITADGLHFDVFVGSTLVDMYVNCGSLEEACEVFGKMPNQDVVLWNAMIAGYAQHGQGLLAVECFKTMQQKRTKPDKTTFTVLLNACSRAGLVDQGREYFKLMKQCYDITPDVLHYNCMVDLLARAKCFEEAETLLQCTVNSNFIGWMALLSACKMHNNVELGKRSFEQIIRLNSSYSHILEVLT